MILLKIFDHEIDAALFIFCVSCAGGLAWWLLKMYQTINKVKGDVSESRKFNMAAIANAKTNLDLEILRIDKNIGERQLVHKEDIRRISEMMGSHSMEDERKFSHISDVLGEINKEMGKIGTMAQLIIDGKIKN